LVTNLLFNSVVQHGPFNWTKIQLYERLLFFFTYAKIEYVNVRTYLSK